MWQEQSASASGGMSLWSWKTWKLHLLNFNQNLQCINRKILHSLRNFLIVFLERARTGLKFSIIRLVVWRLPRPSAELVSGNGLNICCSSGDDVAEAAITTHQRQFIATVTNCVQPAVQSRLRTAAARVQPISKRSSDRQLRTQRTERFLLLVRQLKLLSVS